MNYPNNPAGLRTLKDALRKAAPSIAFSILWEHDDTSATGPDPSDIANIYNPGNGLDGEDPDDWQAWQSEARAECIIDGETATGSDYLCGTYERADDVPAESNPFISGYLPNMFDRALDELTRHPGHPAAEIDAARQVLKTCNIIAAPTA